LMQAVVRAGAAGVPDREVASAQRILDFELQALVSSDVLRQRETAKMRQTVAAAEKANEELLSETWRQAKLRGEAELRGSRREELGELRAQLKNARKVLGRQDDEIKKLHRAEARDEKEAARLMQTPPSRLRGEKDEARPRTLFVTPPDSPLPDEYYDKDASRPRSPLGTPPDSPSPDKFYAKGVDPPRSPLGTPPASPLPDDFYAKDAARTSLLFEAPPDSPLPEEFYSKGYYMQLQLWARRARARVKKRKEGANAEEPPIGMEVLLSDSFRDKGFLLQLQLWADRAREAVRRRREEKAAEAAASSDEHALLRRASSSA